MCAIAKRQRFAHPAATEPDGFGLFGHKGDGFDAAAFVRSIAKGLGFALAACAIPVFLACFYLYFIRCVLQY